MSRDDGDKRKRGICGKSRSVPYDETQGEMVHENKDLYDAEFA